MRNRIAKEKRLGIAILAIALVALLVLTACTPRPIVEEKTAEIGWIMPFTGAGASACQVMLSGGADYARYFNEQEVIPGVRIGYLWRDTSHSVALFISHYERLAAAGIPFIFFTEESGPLAVREKFERDEIVGFSQAGHHDVTYPGFDYYYTHTPTIPEQFAVFLQYFMENWKEERAPRLGTVGMDHATGYSLRYATGYARDLGFEVLLHEVVPIVTLDATVQLLRLKEAGADLIYMQGHPPVTIPVLRDAERLGLVGQIQFSGHSSSIGDRVIEAAGVACEGFLMPRTCPYFDETELPGIKLIIDNMMKYHGKVDREGEYFYGWIGAAITCEAMRRAIENVGYENLDGLAIKEAMDGMKDFDVYGLASVTYKPDDRRGITKMAVYEVRGEKLVRVSDWQEAPVGRDWEYGG
jgi:branched-chain amino acid transport system substrate-binding protein